MTGRRGRSLVVGGRVSRVSTDTDVLITGRGSINMADTSRVAQLLSGSKGQHVSSRDRRYHFLFLRFFTSVFYVLMHSIIGKKIIN